MRLTHRLTFTALLSLVFGLVLLFAMGSVFWIAFAGANKNTAALMGQLTDLSMTAVVEQVDGQLDPVESALRDLAGQHAVQRGETALIGPLLSGTLGALPQLEALVFITPDRQLLGVSRSEREATSAPVPNLSWVHRLLELPMAQAQAHWQPPVWSGRLHRAVIPVAYPVVREGAFQGLLVAAIDIQSFSEFVTRISEQVGRTVFILYGREQVLAYPGLHEEELHSLTRGSPLPDLRDIQDPILQRMWAPTRSPRSWQVLEQTASHQLRLGERRLIFYYRELGGHGPQPWLVGSYVELLEQPEAVNRLYWVLGGGALLLILFLVMTRWFSTLIGSRMASIAEGFAAVGTEPPDRIPDLPGSSIAELDQVAQAYNGMLRTLKEHRRVRGLFGQYLPERVAKELLENEQGVQPRLAEATILFCDLEGFTGLAQQMPPADLVGILNQYFTSAVDILEEHGGVVTQFQGDAILATFNLPTPQSDHAQQALEAAGRLIHLVQSQTFADVQLACRIGIATGEVMAGSVGARGRLSYTVHGDAVNLAARLEGLNKVYGTRVLVAEGTQVRVPPSALRFVTRARVRGRQSEEPLYTLASTWDAESQRRGEQVSADPGL